MFFHNFLLTISIILVGVQGQVFGQSTFECVDGNSTLPICTERDKKNVACGKIDPNDQAALVACVCNQEWMTLTIQCREELRNCLKSTVVDGNFTVELDAWHSACDKKLPTPVTTPSYATTFITANLQSCNPIVASCSRWKASASACTSTYTAASDRLSCECEPSMISLGSVCQYDGSRLCEGKTAFITDLWEYSLCPAGSSILSGGLTAGTASTIHVTGAAITGASPTQTTSIPTSTTISSASRMTVRLGSDRTVSAILVALALRMGMWAL